MEGTDVVGRCGGVIVGAGAGGCRRGGRGGGRRESVESALEGTPPVVDFGRVEERRRGRRGVCYVVV